MAQPQVTKERLQQLEPGPAVLRIQHHAHGAIGPQTARHGIHFRRIGQMMPSPHAQRFEGRGHRHGRAGKAPVIAMVTKILDPQAEPTLADAADALALVLDHYCVERKSEVSRRQSETPRRMVALG